MNSSLHMILAYFNRYHNTKILQFQASSDRYFPPDSEVSSLKLVY